MRKRLLSFREQTYTLERLEILFFDVKSWKSKKKRPSHAKSLIHTHIYPATLGDRHLNTTKNDKKLFSNENCKKIGQSSMKQTHINFIETIVMEVPRPAQMKRKDFKKKCCKFCQSS